MGRGHYPGGSTILYLTEDGTRFSTTDLHEPVLTNKKSEALRHAPKRSSPDPRKTLLNSVLDDEVQGRTKTCVPKNTPTWLVDEVGHADGPHSWARKQPSYRELKLKKESRSLNRGTRKNRALVASARPTPASKLAAPYETKPPPRSGTAGKKAGNALSTKRRVALRPAKPIPPTSLPVALAKLDADRIIRLISKGWVVSGRHLIPPAKRKPPSKPPKPNSPNLPGKKGTVRGAQAWATASIKAPKPEKQSSARKMPQSSVLAENTKPISQEEWLQRINWSSANDGVW